VDKRLNGSDNSAVVQSVEQIVKEHRKAAAKVRKQNRKPAKARAFLIRAGILERHAGSPNGVRLAKRFR
jgi:hypothetical protein